MQKRKFSKQREAIIENLKNRCDHPTADMVYSDLRQIYPNVSLGTVYRNLSLLAENNEIKKLVSDDGVTHFDYNIKSHDHFVCRKCGAMSDLHIINCENLTEEISKNFDGYVEKCDIMSYGLCKNCYNQESN